MKPLLALLPAMTLAACYAHPAPPPLTPNPPGGAYRALGTEPFWGLTIDERQMVFTQPDAAPVAQPTPRVIVGIAGEIYQTPRLNVNIVHAQCSDGMSDRVYPDRVQVTVDGRRFEGCGGEAVAPAALAGTNWRVAAVNGQATPTRGEYFINFQAGNVGAKFGCNAMGGRYEQSANSLVVEDLSQTLIGCPEPQATLERHASAVLTRPMTMSWSGGDRLTLSNAAGRIELARSY